MGTTILDILGERQQNCSVEAGLPLRQVLEIMRERDLGAVAVIRGERVVGVFAGRDLIRRVVLDGLDLSSCRVEEMMTSPPYWISTDERYEVAKAIMVDHDLRQLVVLDPQHKFRGFVTSRQLLEADLVESRELVGKLNDSYYAPKFHPEYVR
ncbi:MAG: CBS domain-containing protein [Myxococcales bacterium]|nr:CBS domain-containing protein [Myxococcales bacterium]